MVVNGQRDRWLSWGWVDTRSVQGFTPVGSGVEDDEATGRDWGLGVWGWQAERVEGPLV